MYIMDISLGTNYVIIAPRPRTPYPTLKLLSQNSRIELKEWTIKAFFLGKLWGRLGKTFCS